MGCFGGDGCFGGVCCFGDDGEKRDLKAAGVDVNAGDCTTKVEIEPTFASSLTSCQNKNNFKE